MRGHSLMLILSFFVWRFLLSLFILYVKCHSLTRLCGCNCLTCVLAFYTSIKPHSQYCETTQAWKLWYEFLYFVTNEYYITLNSAYSDLNLLRRTSFPWFFFSLLSFFFFFFFPINSNYMYIVRHWCTNIFPCDSANLEHTECLNWFNS